MIRIRFFGPVELNQKGFRRHGQKNADQVLNSINFLRKYLEQDNGHFSVLVKRRSGILSVKIVHKVNGTKWRRRRCFFFPQKADIQFSALQVHCPEVSSKAKAMENCRYTIVPIWRRLRLFRINTSANQLSLYGAVAEMCEEYETFHERTERPVVMGQASSSLVLSVIKTEVPLDCDERVNQDLLLQQFGERIEKLSQQNKLSKICMDAGFLNFVEIG